MKSFNVLALFVLFSWAHVKVEAAEPVKELTYATVGNTELKLDLILPAREKGSADGLIVWVHGGAWSSGSKANCDLKALTARGWAIASVDYRLSGTARFPAQAFDLKAAIRFLRAHAEELGYPANRFAIAGSSAGGHLAALVGVTNGKSELEGTEGNFLQVSSDVQAIVVLYGASNLTTILSQSTPHGLSVRKPALDALLGGSPEAKLELARLASPVFQVDANDPPLLILHGDQDIQMPVNQALELQGAYEKAGLTVVLKVVHGAGHGGPMFTSEVNLEMIDLFLREHLPPEQAKRKDLGN